jgi:hypothetical protein
MSAGAKDAGPSASRRIWRRLASARVWRAASRSRSVRTAGGPTAARTARRWRTESGSAPTVTRTDLTMDMLTHRPLQLNPCLPEVQAAIARIPDGARDGRAGVPPDDTARAATGSQGAVARAGRALLNREISRQRSHGARGAPGSHRDPALPLSGRFDNSACTVSFVRHRKTRKRQHCKSSTHPCSLSHTAL